MRPILGRSLKIELLVVDPESFLTISIAPSSNAIGLKDHVFSTYWLPIEQLDSL